MADQQESISKFFRTTLRAPLRNDRWSWGAINPATGQLFLRVWDDERETIGGLPCILIHAKNGASSSRGRPEREQQIERMQNGIQTYGVVCVARDIQAPRRTIKSFKTDTLLRFSGLIDQAQFVYAIIAGNTATAAVRDRVQIPAGITADDVRSALKRLSRGESHQFGVSTGWDVIHDGKSYPQKAVLGLAAERLAARPLGPNDFTAGSPPYPDAPRICAYSEARRRGTNRRGGRSRGERNQTAHRHRSNRARQSHQGQARTRRVSP